MDIPDTGAVFAFGRSHLTISGEGNDNNYFFVKRDKIKKLICGENQSAVICESGRLFVWGENPCGQLAIGTCENVVTKPSCVKNVKKMGHTVKDFQYGSNFSVLLTDSSKVFYAGKDIFPFNAKIDSLTGVFQHEITATPVELKEYERFNDKFDMIRAGDEHFALLNETRDKLYGWGFNSHYQLGDIDTTNILMYPDVFFQADLDETIKLLECGKLSTCLVTEFNDLYLVGRFKNMSISSFTKIREPVQNSVIVQLSISDGDDIFLLTDSGNVYRSTNMTSVLDMRFEEVHFPGNEEKIIKVAPGLAFISIMTESGRCFSLLDEDKTNLIESGKLKELNVIDINAGAQHVLVSTFLRDEDYNGNGDSTLNQTYTISFNKITEMGSGADNYQEPVSVVTEKIKSAKVIESLSTEKSDDDEKTDNISLMDTEESLRGNNGSRATTLECKDTDSSNSSSTHNKHSTTDRPDSVIRYIDNGIDKRSASANRMRNGSAKMNLNDTSEDNEDDEDRMKISRKKTPMPRARKLKEVTDEDLDENGIIDRDEDIYDDNDDVSTSTLRGSDESLQDYINEENKVNSMNKANGNIINEKFKKVKKFMIDMKDKGKGLSCKNSDTVIDEYPQDTETNVRDNHKKSCSIM
ncbi:rho GTPase-activating protein gacGG [Chironomus tepperi]|uniref:rho GTPase-activating protein gacGG n=1 Tax=Chironomus tepperi TaxID=113505 RepID=UPI00391EFAA5